MFATRFSAVAPSTRRNSRTLQRSTYHSVPTASPLCSMSSHSLEVRWCCISSRRVIPSCLTRSLTRWLTTLKVTRRASRINWSTFWWEVGDHSSKTWPLRRLSSIKPSQRVKNLLQTSMQLRLQQAWLRCSKWCPLSSRLVKLKALCKQLSCIWSMSSILSSAKWTQTISFQKQEYELTSSS